MNGIMVETVASSWIEALGGLSHRYMRKVPPGFWADAGLATSTKAAANAAANPTGRWRTLSSLLGALTGCACSAGAATSIASRGREHLRVLGVGRHGRGVASARRRARRSIELLSFARAGSGKQALDLLDEFPVRGKRAPLACHANVGLPGTRIAGQPRQPFAFSPARSRHRRTPGLCCWSIAFSANSGLRLPGALGSARLDAWPAMQQRPDLTGLVAARGRSVHHAISRFAILGPRLLHTLGGWLGSPPPERGRSTAERS